MSGASFGLGGIHLVHPHCNNAKVADRIAQHSTDDLIVVVAHVLCRENQGIPFYDQADGRNLRNTALSVATSIRKLRKVEVVVRDIVDLQEHDGDTQGPQTHRPSTYFLRNLLERARLAYRDPKIILDPFYCTGGDKVHVVPAFIRARDLSLVPDWRTGVRHGVNLDVIRS